MRPQPGLRRHEGMWRQGARRHRFPERGVRTRFSVMWKSAGPCAILICPHMKTNFPASEKQPSPMNSSLPQVKRKPSPKKRRLQQPPNDKQPFANLNERQTAASIKKNLPPNEAQSSLKEMANFPTKASFSQMNANYPVELQKSKVASGASRLRSTSDVYKTSMPLGSVKAPNRLNLYMSGPCGPAGNC